MNLPHVLVHHITPRKNTLGGAYFHTTDPIPALRWSIGAKVTSTGVKIDFGGRSPARVEVDLIDAEVDALIEILTHAAALRSAESAAAQAKKAA